MLRSPGARCCGYRPCNQQQQQQHQPQHDARLHLCHVVAYFSRSLPAISALSNTAVDNLLFRLIFEER